MGSMLVGLHIKGTLAGESFIISSSWQPWEGQSLQDQQGPRCQSISNTGLIHRAMSCYASGLTASLGQNDSCKAKYGGFWYLTMES